MSLKDPVSFIIARYRCPIRDINKKGRRNGRKDSTPKFFINSFINGYANGFYREDMVFASQ